MIAKRPLAKKHTAWLAQIDEWKKKAPFAYRITPEIANSDHMIDHMQGNENEVILQQMVIETLYELTKGEAYITTGVGQHQMWAGQWYKYTHPRQFITSADVYKRQSRTVTTGICMRIWCISLALRYC